MKETRMNVPDMACGHCVAAIRSALETREGVEEIDVYLETKTVKVRAISELEEDDLVGAVRAAGYSPEVEG
jgi:copper chaperone